jgi:hypothetical protein
MTTRQERSGHADRQDRSRWGNRKVGRHVVDVLEADGHDVVPISRSSGVDVVTGDGLADALAGVACIIDVATQPSPSRRSPRPLHRRGPHLQTVGEWAGVKQIVVVFHHRDRPVPRRLLSREGRARAGHALGPDPLRILRAAQFHEFVRQLVEWSRQGEVSCVPSMRTQSSPHGPLRRRSPTWPTDRRRLDDPSVRRSPRSPVRGKKTSSTWRSRSPPGAASRYESRA